MSENAPQEPGQIVRRFDPLTFFAAQFVPVAVRQDYLTLHAFDLEVRKIPVQVRDPMAGEVRLQWWREVCYGERGEEAGANRLASAVQAMLATHQIHANFIDPYFDGRIFDLYADDIGSVKSFEAYAGQTAGTINQLACLIVSRENSARAAELSGYLSCVQTLINKVIRPLRRGSSSVARYLPMEPLQAETQVEAKNPYLITDARTDADLLSAAMQFGSDYLRQASTSSRDLPESLRPAFLPFVFCGDEIKGTVDPSTMPSYRLIWRLWRRSRQWPVFS